ncbi:MAG: 16S rRNA (cytidine(1402)-2'-O)-methyltransferase [Flavobacteriaceae bacterium]|nr:16S rRNA (cytidine(1402)-2'-O)-methyltransferase [Flavobacteriaceae bacterium]
MTKLYIVPTPIGNLEDITLRSISVLTNSDLILCEDKRRSKILMSHYKINSQLKSFHKFNEHKEVNNIVAQIKNGKKISLISDAGTPGISDPGFLIVRTCLESEIEIECLPGATAFVPALINSGIPCDKFVFEGFLPVKKGRKSRLEKLTTEDRTMIFYESPHKILKTLKDFKSIFGPDRKISISRELTKVYEENTRSTIGQVITIFEEKNIKGEIVIVVEGNKKFK